MNYSDALKIDATLVANEFLDQYMPGANGDFVKVYLFFLRNRENGIDVASVADHLQLTEGDVRRAMKYWERVGILSVGGAKSSSAETVGAEPPVKAPADSAAASGETEAAALPVTEEAKRRALYRTQGAREILLRLSEDEEFEQLLRVVQKYLSKILNDTEQQTFAYLYDGLHMPFEVIDYLVQYCVGHGHTSMRYIEKVGLDWADHGITRLSAAKAYTSQFDQKAGAAKKRKSAARDSLGTPVRTDYDSKAVEEIVRKMM